MFHDLEEPGSIHVPYNWTYADAAERAAATGFVSTDVGKLARQLDNDSIWMLTATTPTWTSFGGSGTVTNSAGALTANSIVLGADGSDTKIVAGITTDGISRLQLGVAGTSVGGVEFRNATSGTVSLVPVTGALGTAVLTLPAVTDTLVALAATQTLTNKTLTAPVIATISNTGTLTLPTATDTLVGRATTDTLTNKTLSTATSVSVALSFTAGVRQTFAPDATNAGLNVGSFAGVPSSLSNGDLFYDSTAGALKARISGSTVSLGAGGGSGTVNSGSAGQLAYYVSTAAAVSGSSLLAVNGSGLTLAGGAGLGGNAASTLAFDFLTSTGFARWFSQGADTSTNGKFQLLSMRSNGSNSIAAFTWDGNATLTPSGTGYFHVGASAYALGAYSYYNSIQYPFAKTDTTSRGGLAITSNDASNPWGLVFNFQGHSTATSRVLDCYLGAIGVDGHGVWNLRATEIGFYGNNGGTLGGKVTSTGFQGVIGATTPAAATFTYSCIANAGAANPGGWGANKSVMDFFSGAARWFSYGTDGSTNGGFVFNSQRSDGSNSTNVLVLASTGTATFSSSVTTGAPSGGTAGAWKFGIRVAATVAFDTSQYLQLDVGGTLYKVAVAV